MDMLKEFWNSEICYRFSQLIDDDTQEFVADNSDFTVVDGEEGDYGVIRYSDAAGQLVAVRTVHGGDSEDVAFTDHGKAMMRNKLRAVMEKALTPSAK